jgi:DNA-binding NtrC family response regulator
LHHGGKHARWCSAGLSNQSPTSDFTLPGYGGPLALQLVRELGIDAPFIFVSGTMGEERPVEAMRSGANDYLLKGNVARLAPAVARELEQARVHRERRATEERYRVLFEHRRRSGLWCSNGLG